MRPVFQEDSAAPTLSSTLNSRHSSSRTARKAARFSLRSPVQWWMAARGYQLQPSPSGSLTSISKTKVPVLEAG
jgi:hypothetical protein